MYEMRLSQLKPKHKRNAPAMEMRDVMNMTEARNFVENAASDAGIASGLLLRMKAGEALLPEHTEWLANNPGYKDYPSYYWLLRKRFMEFVQSGEASVRLIHG